MHLQGIREACTPGQEATASRELKPQEWKTEVPGTLLNPNPKHRESQPKENMARDQPETSQRPARDQPGTSQGPARDQPGTSQRPARNQPETSQRPARDSEAPEIREP